MESLSLLDRFNNWVKESIIVKLMSIGFLMLILLIPSNWVESLIQERQSRADEVVQEVSSKWATSQVVNGPVLRIPYKKISQVKEWTAAGTAYTRTIETVQTAYFLPEELTIDGNIVPEIRHRGIFDVVVYKSNINFKATFGNVVFNKWNIPDEQVLWDDAALVVGIQDMQGIYENPKITSGSKSFDIESSSDIGVDESTGIVIPFDWKSREDILKEFNVDLALKGSEGLYFIPTGKSTSVSLASVWPSPSFDGKMLPITSDITETGFKAKWSVLSFNRAIADEWTDNEQSMKGTEFGVKLLIPADQYQKSMRTAKYDALIILLAFTALFLVEITRKVRIHPFQYILVGVALIVYYTLLLSISEHMGYNTAYAIASTATVLLLSLYSITFLKAKPLVVLFSVVMSIFYVFIFVIIQAQDYSLLIGSIGLFLITAIVMYFSRNIRWYSEDRKTDDGTVGS
jgi:inner membrane protein